MKQHIRFCTAQDGVRVAFAVAGDGPPIARVNNWFTHLDHDWVNPVWRHWSEALPRTESSSVTTRAAPACPIAMSAA